MKIRDHIQNSQISFDVSTTWTGDTDTDWSDDDNWDNCKPCAEISAIIPEAPSDQPLVGSIEETLDLTLEKGAELTVEAGHSLAVYGDFYLQADDSQSSSFIDEGTMNIQGEVYADFYLDEDRWHYVSSPVDGAMSEVFLSIYLSDWFEDTQSWSYINPIDVPLNAGEGFAAWSSSATTGNKTIVFTGGNLNTGTFNLNVSATDIDGNLSIDSDEGWNFVGNPYPSAVDWDLSGWTKTNLISSVYVWNGSQYLVWNGLVGSLTDGIIPAMQGFMVKASDFNPVLQTANSTRLHGAAAYKKQEIVNLLTLKVEGDTYSDECFIHFNPEATQGFDEMYDAYKRYGIEAAPQIYSQINEIKYTINELPLEETMTIPLGFECGADGEFTLTIEGIKKPLIDKNIILEDLKEGVSINLTKEHTYTFYSQAEDNTMRFKLHFGVLGESEIYTSKALDVYSSNHTIFIQNPENLVGVEMEVVNIMGQTILHTKLSSNSSSEVETEIPTGYYMIKLIHQKSVYTEKVFIR